MDGATKYVKGDATAGLIITAINLIGGIVLGVVVQGTEISDALSKYTILTIGDGLVSQIPSLLISLSTGIIVTKASKESDLGNVLIRQLFSIPKVLYIVGFTMVFLGICTPLNTLLCLIYAVLFIAAGRAIQANVEEAEIEDEVETEEQSAEEIRRPENVVSLFRILRIPRPKSPFRRRLPPRQHRYMAAFWRGPHWMSTPMPPLRTVSSTMSPRNRAASGWPFPRRRVPAQNRASTPFTPSNLPALCWWAM